MLFFEDALDQNTIDELTAAFAALVDHPRHVGYAYDLFGELLKLHQSQFFIRPPGGERYNIWHPDGARAVPYGTFSPELPLQIKIGFWLTDLPEAKRRRPASQEDLLCPLPHLAYPDRAREGGFGEVAIRLR